MAPTELFSAGGSLYRFAGRTYHGREQGAFGARASRVVRCRIFSEIIPDPLRRKLDGSPLSYARGMVASAITPVASAVRATYRTAALDRWRGSGVHRTPPSCRAARQRGGQPTLTVLGEICGTSPRARPEPFMCCVGTQKRLKSRFAENEKPRQKVRDYCKLLDISSGAQICSRQICDPQQDRSRCHYCPE